MIGKELTGGIEEHTGALAPKKEKPIFFDETSVRAIFAGVKTQTRRAFHLPESQIENLAGATLKGWHPCYQPGDILWVRETWGVGIQAAGGIIFRADYAGKKAPLAEGHKWRPSLIMPRHAARIFLRVTDVKVERLQDISECDAIAEGLEDATNYTPSENIGRFVDFWNNFNLKRGYGWDTNPWVWAYTFERIRDTDK